ncbi:hypothetical protein KY290_025317 [Solanum tuberosum]|uniref:Uncharacterized protein n=1 Tax=Solanum tuberosum TaxID=4113 RepID=A0ABQ7UVA7_SOLTU|nr:hypothetical protein KY290_025317 [Solanum tuberosum]
MAFRKSSDFLYKDFTDVVSADLSHVDPITRRKFNNGRLDGSEYFTSLETVKNNNSYTIVVTATPGAILHPCSLENFLKLAPTLLSPSKGDMQTNIDNEQPVFCYIPREHRKKGQSLLEECTQQVHPPRKELSYTTFQDLKEKMIVPVAQVMSITLKPSKGNTQVGYDFSNPVKL